MVVTGLLHLMYGSNWVCLKKMFNNELYCRKYRTEEEMKIKFKGIRSKVKMFIKISLKIDKELLDEDEEVIVKLSRMEYKNISNEIDFSYEHVWNFLKHVPCF